MSIELSRRQFLAAAGITGFGLVVRHLIGEPQDTGPSKPDQIVTDSFEFDTLPILGLNKAYFLQTEQRRLDGAANVKTIAWGPEKPGEKLSVSVLGAFKVGSILFGVVTVPGENERYITNVPTGNETVEQFLNRTKVPWIQATPDSTGRLNVPNLRTLSPTDAKKSAVNLTSQQVLYEYKPVGNGKGTSLDAIMFEQGDLRVRRHRVIELRVKGKPTFSNLPQSVSVSLSYETDLDNQIRDTKGTAILNLRSSLFEGSEPATSIISGDSNTIRSFIKKLNTNDSKKVQDFENSFERLMEKWRQYHLAIKRAEEDKALATVAQTSAPISRVPQARLSASVTESSSETGINPLAVVGGVALGALAVTTTALVVKVRAQGEEIAESKMRGDRLEERNNQLETGARIIYEALGPGIQALEASISSHKALEEQSSAMEKLTNRGVKVSANVVQHVTELHGINARAATSAREMSAVVLSNGRTLKNLHDTLQEGRSLLSGRGIASRKLPPR